MVLPVCQDKSTLGANDEPNWDSMMEPMANSAMLLTYKAATKRFFKAAALEGTAEFKMHNSKKISMTLIQLPSSTVIIQ